ncbi:replication initiator [Knoellia sp. p5-6-4]|uniref:replication initiator n=1 Tax=unclassified Knoellia TaxID=2618719 RepID=UPI0023DBA703|nr:replication initiator [Knoellia sp. p5-6-4]MDF2144658.1 hypothetical protein [Knoellia sp. p5-6-4]
MTRQPAPSTESRHFPGFGEGAGLPLGDLSPSQERDILRRLTSRTFDEWASAAAGVGYCANPVRLRGRSTTFDKGSGEAVGEFSSDRLPLGVLHLRCGNRRESKCPSCSRLYAADTFHLIRCGVVGGKGVPEHVVDNPLVFATLTAPSFGAVHGLRDGRRCHPRSGKRSRCPHGRSLSCMAVHREDDSLLGQPICWECYDYASHVVWQWWAPELWRRFTITLRRRVARHLGIRPTKLNDLATVQYAKVAEFQLRGVVHFHALVRLDGPRTDGGFAPAPPALDAGVVADLVAEAAAAVSFVAPDVLDQPTARTLRFGSQVDTRPVRHHRRTDDPDRGLDAEQVAGYLAKYSTKSATESAGDDATNRHLERLRQVADAIADWAEEDECAVQERGGDGPVEHPYERMAKWVHMLGFRGHFSTKSRRYSVTLGALRRARRRASVLIAQARADGQRIDLKDLEAELMADEDEETTLVIGQWAFAGTGWETPGDAAMAKAAAARAREYAQWKAAQKAGR